MVGWETCLVGNRSKRMDVLKRLRAFLLFANSPVAPCTSHISLLDHILLHLLFLRSVMGWGSLVLLLPLLNQKAKDYGEKEKKNHVVTSQKC